MNATARANVRKPLRSEPGALEGAQLHAILRCRRRWLWKQVPRRLVDAARLLPALLGARFKHPRLTGGDPPGLPPPLSNKRWAHLARTFGLPEPTRLYRPRALISTLIAFPAPSSLSVLALLAPKLSTFERESTVQWLAKVEEFLAAAGTPLRFEIHDSESLGNPSTVLLRAWLFGALIAGELPVWSAEGNFPAAKALKASEWVVLGDAAPTRLCRLALMTLGGQTLRSPPEVFLEALRRGDGIRALAHPELACTTWAAEQGPEGHLLYEVLRHASSSPYAAKAASRRLAEPRDQPLDAGQLLKLGQKLVILCARATRRVAPPGSELREQLRPGLFSAGYPDALLPALGHALRIRGLAPPAVRKRLVERRRAGLCDIGDGAALRLASGKHQSQVRIRALALLGRAAGLPVRGNIKSRSWDRISTLLAKPPTRRTFVLLIRSKELPGPPFDFLNRGPERLVALQAVGSILLRPNSRPSSRQLTAAEAVQRILAEAARGSAVEILTDDAQAQPAILRLTNLAQLRTRSIEQQTGLALEVGGRVWLCAGGRTHSFSLEAFTRRPRQCLVDSAAPDLPSVSGARALRNVHMLKCFVSGLEDRQVLVTYTDAENRRFQERVDLQDLHPHLRETEELLRSSTRSCLLSIETSPELEELMHRRFDERVPPANIALSGQLPFHLFFSRDDDQLELRLPSAWQTAALSVLSLWPPGTLGRIRVKQVTVSSKVGPVEGLLKLYARSFVVRRLMAHIERLCRP